MYPYKFKILFAFLFSLFGYALTAQQTSFEKDSTAFEKKFLKMQDAFSQDYETANNYFETALLILDSLSVKHNHNNYFLKRKADVLNKLCVSDLHKGEFENALIRLNQSINIRKEYGKPNDAASSYYLKGIVWVRQGNYEKAKINYDSAYVMTERNIAKGLPHHAFKSTLLNLYGTHYANVDSLGKSEYYFKKAITYADSLKDKNTAALNRIQYAEVITDFNRHNEALELRKQAYKNYLDLGLKEAQMDALSDMATSYNALGNYKKAYPLKKQFVEHLKSTGQMDKLMLEYPFYIDILGKNRKYAEAFEVQKRYAIIRDSLRNADNYKELADLDAKHKYESQKSIDSLSIISNRKIIEAKQAKEASTKFWLVVVVFLIVITVVTFYYIRNKQKIKEQAYQNILLNNKVATKTEEINELLTETIQHIKSKERIAENLQKLSNESEGITLKNIMADLKASKADNAKLILIKQNIEQVNFEFIKKLKTLHPQLTKTDVEICSLIRIGLVRKEVANLRNTSLEAVKTSRFRLKKKLNLSTQDNLDNYINTL